MKLIKAPNTVIYTLPNNENLNMVIQNVMLIKRTFFSLECIVILKS